MRLASRHPGLSNSCTIRPEQGQCITQLQYLLQLSSRTSEKTQNANFALTEFYEVPHSPGLTPMMVRSCGPQLRSASFRYYFRYYPDFPVIPSRKRLSVHTFGHFPGTLRRIQSIL
jgi:hypothetical protein